MVEDFNFRFYGAIDASAMQQKVNNAGFDWDAYDFRQKVHKVHRETKTIPLIWNEQLTGKQKLWEGYELFSDELKQILHILNNAQKRIGVLHTAILINLEKQMQVYPHIDAHPFFKSVHRIHIPIFTNPQCLFTVAGETIHMQEGEIWEINNDAKMHSVVNNGDTDRIHLLLDWRELAKT